MHPRFRTPLRFLVSLVPVLLLASCSDDDDGNGGPPAGSATADFLIGDAAVDELLSFSAEIQSVRLRRQNGLFTNDLLTAGTVDVEFLGLDEARALLVRAQVPVDSYTDVEIGFTPGDYAATDAVGGDVTVTASVDSFLAPLPGVVTLLDDDYGRFEVDVDLVDALSGDVSAGAVTFDPTGVASFSDGTTDVTLDPFKALVTASDVGTNTLTVQGFSDDAQTVSLGTMTVRTTTTALFLDETDAELTGPAFYAALVPNLSLVEVHGELSQDGEVDATLVEIEDQNGGAGSTDLVRLEGVIVAVGATDFALRVREIEDGGSVAAPILDALPDGPIDVSFDLATVFLLGRTQVVDETALAVGREATVEFCSFATEPFPACVVEVGEGEASFRGVVTDVAGLPGAVVVRLDASDPAIAGGFVQDELTDVDVDLTGSTIVFGDELSTTLLPADIATGLEISNEGTFTGLPTAPTLTATRTTLTGGRLEDAGVTAFNETTRSFTTVGGDLVDPFGANVTAGPQLVLLEPTATFTGDASTESEFFALLATTLVGVEVDVHGLGTANPNEIRAFVVKITAP